MSHLRIFNERKSLRVFGADGKAPWIVEVEGPRGIEEWLELVGRRTQGCKVYANPTSDGPQYVSVAQVGSRHVKRGGLSSADPWEDRDLRPGSILALFEVEYPTPGQPTFRYRSREGGEWLTVGLLDLPAGYDWSRYIDGDDRRTWPDVWPGVDVVLRVWPDRLGLWLTVKDPGARHEYRFLVAADGDVLPRGIRTASEHVTNPQAIEALCRAGGNVRTLEWQKALVRPFAAWDVKGKSLTDGRFHYKQGVRTQTLAVQPADAYPLTLDTDVTEQVGASADDGYLMAGIAFDTTGGSFLVGSYYTYDTHCWARWTTVAVDQGATIGDGGVAKYKAQQQDNSDSCVTRLYMNAADDAASPTNEAGYNGKALTTNYGAWTIGELSKDTWYNSPSITAALQEVAGRAGWETGHAMMALHKEQASADEGYRYFYAYDDAAANAPKLVFAWSGGAAPQTITGSGIASAVAFGSATVTPGAVTITGSGIASGNVFGSAAITTGAVTITATGIASAAAVGEPALGQVVKPDGIASAAAVGEPALTVGPVTIEATGIPSAEAVGEPTVIPGAVNIAATAIESTEVFGAATVTPGAVSVAAQAIESAVAFGQPTVLPGAVAIIAVGIESAADLGSATVTPGAVSILAQGIPSSEAVGEPAVSLGPVTIQAQSIESQLAFGSAAVTPGPVSITAESIASAAAIGEPTVTPGAVSIQAQSIESAEAFGSAAVTTGPVTIAAEGIPSTLVVGEATVTPGPVGIVAESIPSSAAVGEPAVQPGPVAIATEGIASTEVFGEAVLTPGPVTIAAQGIESSETFGAATVSPGPVAIQAQGIGSTETLGQPTVTPGPVAVAVQSIPSTETFGEPQVLPGPVSIEAQGIPTTESIGSPAVTPGPVTIATLGIASGLTFGAPSVQPGPVTIQGQGIPSGATVGEPTVIPALLVIVASSIASGVTFGELTVIPGPVTIEATGIPSAVTFGNARVAHPITLPIKALGHVIIKAVGDQRYWARGHVRYHAKGAIRYKAMGHVRIKAVVNVGATVYLTVGQTYPVIQITAQDDDGNVIDWTGWDSVVFYLADAHGTIKVNGKDAAFGDPRTGGKLSYTCGTTDVDTKGTFYGQFKATDGTAIAFVPSAANDAIKVVIAARVGS